MRRTVSITWTYDISYLNPCPGGSAPHRGEYWVKILRCDATGEAFHVVQRDLRSPMHALMAALRDIYPDRPDLAQKCRDDLIEGCGGRFEVDDDFILVLDARSIDEELAR